MLSNNLCTHIFVQYDNNNSNDNNNEDGDDDNHILICKLYKHTFV